MGDMTEPQDYGLQDPLTMALKRKIDDCPVCGRHVNQLNGEGGTTPESVRWHATPCGHRVGVPTVWADRIELVAAE